MRKLPQNIYFKPYFCLPDTFLAEKLNLRAFTASRKTSHKFSEAGRFEPKKLAWGFNFDSEYAGAKYVFLRARAYLFRTSSFAL